MLIKERYLLNIENKSKILDGHDVFRNSSRKDTWDSGAGVFL